MRRGGDQCLQLAQHGPCALDTREHHGPGGGFVAFRQEQGRGVGDFGQTAACHFKHADFVGGAETVFHGAQDAELVAALAFKIQHGVDHMFDHPWTGDLPVLGDMAYQNHRHAAPFGECGQFMRGGAHLRYAARGGFNVVGPHGLNGIDDRQLRFFGFQCGQNIAQVGFGGQLHRRIAQAQTVGPHAHLCAGFFAGNIDSFQTLAGETCGGLQQKGGFADARITAHQNGRGRHQAPAQHTVQFVHAGMGARWRHLVAGQIGQVQRAATFAAQRFFRRACR